jgi:hypothetical protein
MSSCEKCWTDAGFRAASRQTSKAEEYEALMDERRDTPCTPEEQAGPEATECPRCQRRTVHQYAKQCTICGTGADL